VRVDPISTIISVIALAVSGYVALPDRARLRAKSTFQKFVNIPASIKVEAVNVGRRPVILTRMVWHYGDVSSIATPLEKTEQESGFKNTNGLAKTLLTAQCSLIQIQELT